MYLNGKHLDTTLKLGQSNSGTVSIKQIGISDSLELALAPPLAPPSTTSKLEDTDWLRLTLAPPSGITTQDISPGKHELFSASGIQRKIPFKRSSQRKQFFRITPDVERWLGGKHVQFSKPVPHLLGDHRSAMPHKHMMVGSFPSSLSTHIIQDSSSRYIPRSHGSGSNAVQPFAPRESTAEDLENTLEDRHHSIIDPASSKSHPIQISGDQDETKVPEKHSTEHGRPPPSGEQQTDIFDPDGSETYTAIRELMGTLSRSGKEIIGAHIEIRADIITWFNTLKVGLIQQTTESNKLNGLSARDIQRAVGRAYYKLTNPFLGFLIRYYKHTRESGNIDPSLLTGGWKFLKRYMVQWHDVDLQAVLKLRGKLEVDDRVWKWTPEELLAHLMWMDRKEHLPTKVLSKFISEWKKSEAL
ncbi:uncharacterized protein MELLADRAFT_91059 [Melampsora larici-populina 98AG31]|uniref:Uncharacterized protein n=1 Tax=Melampsora larici-populina (strain 98AG31 / pathotype 3-4-7) TaxID=747676 RepID=F4R8J2_MELLP|nr:uncharacterized protein MELLADRAFT_91059 [Melampsora larici-populina 98AG31]EGG11489.1 hypothetical protein MELLADRAFT_91059 [Melampsora larici-populina 98AG31]